MSKFPFLMQHEKHGLTYANNSLEEVQLREHGWIERRVKVEEVPRETVEDVPEVVKRPRGRPRKM